MLRETGVTCILASYLFVSSQCNHLNYGFDYPMQKSSSSGSTTLKSLDNSCVGKEDGDYWLQLSTDNSDYDPVKVTCSNEYIIINIAKDGGLEQYFSSWIKWHYALAGPLNSDPVTWQEWFIPERDDSDSKYLLSPDCNSCDESSEIQVFGDVSTYWMTGSLAKLFWGITGFNECDFDTDTYQCYNCQMCSQNGACLPSEISDTSIDYTTGGMCGTAVNPSYKAVYKTRQETQSLATTPHYKPSIGTDGRFCVCYQPSDDNIDTYELTETQIEMVNNDISRTDSGNKMLKYAYSNGLRVDGHSPFTVDISDDSDSSDSFDDDDDDNDIIDWKSLIPETEQDKRDTNIVYLKQSDFYDGTYRILESGTYILSEDIEMDFNKDDSYWPRDDQSDIYIGAGDYRNAYCMGFFAGITVESNYVTIDLNNFELRQSMEFYYNQRWFSLIELSNQQFLPGQGPAFFGAYTINVNDVTVKNGVLGRTSHFAIHGNHAQNVLIENVHIKDFVTHGMQLNGWKGLTMKNVEIGPNSVSEYLRGEYGHGRLISRRLRAIEEQQIADGSEDDTVTFDGRSPITISELADELEAQMEMAYEYAINRGKYGGKFEDSDYINPKYLATAAGKERWEKAKTLFVHESGIPSASSVTGMFLNFDGANVNTYAKYTLPEHQSNNAYLENIHIHDLTHDFQESMKLAGHGYLYTTPWLTDIPAEGTFGSKDRLAEFYTALHSMDDDEDSDATPDLSDFKYVGNALTDSYIAMWTLNDDWDILGFLAMVMKDDTANMADWAFGNIEANANWRLNCNQDVMSHSGKGMLGLRIDGSDNVEINGLKIENFYEHSALGSTVCGEYSWIDEEGEGGNFRTRTPMQMGFSGNNLQAVSISSTTNVKISGNIIIDNINTDYSEGFGISVWTANSISIDENALIMIKNMHTGKLLEQGTFTYDSLPNRAPEACAFRLETSDESTLFETDITFEHLNDGENTGFENVLICNVNGHTYCLGDETNGNTMYGSDFGTHIGVCDSVTSAQDISKYLKEYNNDYDNEYSANEQPSDDNNKVLGSSSSSLNGMKNVANNEENTSETTKSNGNSDDFFESLIGVNSIALLLLALSGVGIVALVVMYYQRLMENNKHIKIGEPKTDTTAYSYGTI